MLANHGITAEEIGRVVVFRALYLGDLLLAIPALRSLRGAFREAEITLIGLPWARELIRRFRYVDRFLEFPGFDGIPETSFDEIQTRAFLDAARAYGYDLAIQMHGNGQISNRFVAALGAKCSVGFSLDGASDSLLSLSLPYVEQEHEISKCLRLVQLVGAQGGDSRLEFPLNDADERELRDLSGTHGLDFGEQWIGLHVGAKHPAKLWSVGAWAAVARALAEMPGVRVILTGSKAEQNLAVEVADRSSPRVVNLAGQTSLGGLAALIARMGLLVTGDSGPAHLATAVGTKSVVIFGPTDPRRWGPLDRQRHRVVYKPVSCSPCTNRACPTDHRCLKAITPDDVLAEAFQLLSLQQRS